MKRFAVLSCLLCLTVVLGFESSRAGDEKLPYTRVQDVVYGRKDGTALTMDVFIPKKDANGAAVIYVISGGWFSSHAAINPKVMQVFVQRGYTVFAVVHGSQPRYTIPEILQDM